MVLRGAWEPALLPAKEQDGLEQLGHLLPHYGAVAVTLERENLNWNNLTLG